MDHRHSDSGRCLCGAVSIAASSISNHVGACHCGMCRRWGGGPLMATNCGGDVTFGGEENITVYDSSEWAERGFCNRCGSHLFYRLKESGEYYVPVGLFESTDAFTLDHQVFIDRKPDFYRFANQTDDMTEAEVFARYAAPE